MDPLRQELPRPILEGRFKNVLAVPAHVLAQSLYHSDSPTARARIRQLQEDLKTARMDRVGFPELLAATGTGARLLWG